MTRSIIISVTVLLIGNPLLVKATGLKSIYTLPCGVNNYNIIPVADFMATTPYTLFAADSVTVIAGPQTSNVFSGIAGIAGDNFVVGVINKFTSATMYTPITLNAGTTIIDGQIDCPCTLGIPPVCSATPGVDSITGATYLWTSPGGTTYNQSGFIAFTQPPENGVWTVQASLTIGSCAYTLTNSFLLSNCGLPLLPLKYNYVRASSSNCKIKTEWSTAQEQNSDRFEIEMSENGSAEWRKVATVAAAGFSSSDLMYSAEIAAADLSAPIVFIRIKQIDKDGHSSYSMVLKVNVGCKTTVNKLSVLPGIVQQNDILVVKFESNVARAKSYMILTDVAGRQFLSKPVTINKSANQYLFPLSNFIKGIYFVKLVSAAGDWQSNAVKFIIQ